MSNYFDMNQPERYEGTTQKTNAVGTQLHRRNLANNVSNNQNNKTPTTCVLDSVYKQNQTAKRNRCGTFIPKSGSKTYKTEKMNYNAFFPSQSIYSALCQRKVTKIRRVNLEYTHLRQNYVEKIFSLAERFKISEISSHLAVTLMDSLCYSSSQYNGKLELYSPVALLLAAKTIEFDARIPTIPKLRQVVGFEFSVDEFKTAELVLLGNVDWNPQFTSTFEFVHFFLSQGVVFSSDGYISQSDERNALRDNTQSLNQQIGVKASIIARMNCSSESSKSSEYQSIGSDEIRLKYTNILKPIPTFSTSLSKIGSLDGSKITEIVAKIESSAAKLCNAVVKEIELIELDPVVLSSACVAYLRKINRIAHGWCEELEELTGVSGDLIYPVVDLLHKLLDKQMVTDQSFLYNLATERYQSKETPKSKNAISLLEYRQPEEQQYTFEQISEVNIKDFSQAASQPCSLTSLDSTNSGTGSEPGSQNTLRKNETNKNFHIRRIVPPSYTVIPSSDPVRQPVRRATVSYRIQKNKNVSGMSSMSRPPMPPVVVKTRVLNQNIRSSILGNGKIVKSRDFQQALSNGIPKKTC